MATYVLRRLLFSIPVLFLASVIIFFGVSAVSNPLSILQQQPGVSEITIQNIAERKHLDEPIPVQYGYWVRDALTNRFGTNLFGDRAIWPELRRSMWYTAQLVVAAEIFAIGLAIAIGVVSAKRQYSWFDNLATTGSFVGFSIPIFWAALILQVIFTNLYRATGVRIFYTAGLSSVDPGTGLAFLVDRLQHLALPILALSITSIAQYSRYMRTSMLEVLHSDYVRTARAKGLPERTVTSRHSLRNALIPLTTVIGWNLGVIFGGTIIIETVFGIPGMGRYFFTALSIRDVYPLMAWLMITAIVIIVFNLITDIVYGYLDPRIRYD
ncbi:MAG TPA: ABC transporter permease [Egibacteraceae bacterium]|nr:ABC transporter permease [Egibacteraceae bacterium]